MCQTPQCVAFTQVKNAEAAAAKAAYESSSIIEEAMAQAAAIRRQSEQDAQAKVAHRQHAIETPGVC